MHHFWTQLRGCAFFLGVFKDCRLDIDYVLAIPIDY